MKIVGLAGWSGAGKTTLIAKLLPVLIARGLRVSTIKHAHHAFDIDKPRKDSGVYRQSGASEVLVSSEQRWALIHELRGDAEPDLAGLLDKLSYVDLVLVEGFKSESYPKIEVHRAANGRSTLFQDDSNIVGVITDAIVITALPIANLDDIAAIATMVLSLAIPRENIRTLARASGLQTSPASR